MVKIASVALGLLLLSACQGAGRGTARAPQRREIERLYPLRAGSIWTYDVETGDGPPTLAITRVLASADGHAEVSSGGLPIRYEQRSDGLFREDRNGYVLKLPLRPGATWDAGQGTTAEVTEIDKQVTTPAGEFSGCIEVREGGGDVGKVVRTVFCPDVGPVELESSLALAVSGGTARVLARLRGYDFSNALANP